MAAIFYLPRLFVYHVQALSRRYPRQVSASRHGTQTVQRHHDTRRVLSIVFGLWLLGYGISGGVAACQAHLVLLLVAYHALCWKHLRIRDDRNARSDRYFRIINELPVFLLFGIVIFVVVKPF